jgi:hypothetical protein
MPNIIDLSYFQQANALNIPLSVQVLVANPTLETPNSATALTELITKVEKSILVNALGLATYNELQLAIEDSFTNPLYAKYKKLVEGEEYDGKIWQGLNYEYSLIAWKIYETFLFDTNRQLTGIGNVEVKPQGATMVTPAYKLANANANFIQQYQGGYMRFPIIYNDGHFIDWFGQDESIEVSLYRYLTDKKADFTNVNLETFRIYESINSFGV